MQRTEDTHVWLSSWLLRLLTLTLFQFQFSTSHKTLAEQCFTFVSIIYFQLSALRIWHSLLGYIPTSEPYHFGYLNIFKMYLISQCSVKVLARSMYSPSVTDLTKSHHSFSSSLLIYSIVCSRTIFLKG